jgi:hypothetical protein
MGTSARWLAPLARLGLSLTLALAAGCSSLSDAGRGVERAHDHAAVQGCAFVGDVSVRPSLGSENDDIIRLRNLAAGIGANAIWLDSTVVAPGGSLYAAAFSCRRAPVPAP